MSRLEEIRERIEALDAQLIDTLAERVRLARTLGEQKRAAGLPLLDPAREAAVVRRAAELAQRNGLPVESVRAIWWQVIGLCRAEQEAR